MNSQAVAMRPVDPGAVALSQALLAGQQRHLSQQAGGRDLLAVHHVPFRKEWEDKSLARVLREHTGRPPTLLSLTPQQVHVDTAVSNMLVMYRNRPYIADAVLPIVSVSKRSDKIFQFPIETMQSVAKTQISNSRGRPNEIAYSINTTLNFSVLDYGLIDFVSDDEETNADAPLMPRLASQAILTNFLDLSREVRVAAVAFNTANYGTNTQALTGSARWDTSTSSPVNNILQAISNVFAMGVNTFVIGEQAWVLLRNNAEFKSYVVSRASTGLGPVPAIVDQDFVARSFGLDQVLVGKAKINTANEGAAVVSGWVWGKSAALLRVEPQPNAKMTQCFGYTFRYRSSAYQVQAIPELLLGVRGGTYIKLTHSDAEVAFIGANAAAPAGYLYTTVVS